MNCLFHDCTNSPAGDYPACSAHADTMHFLHRRCHCRHCEAERIAEPALRLVGELREADREFADENELRLDFKSDRVSDFMERRVA